MCWEMRKIDDCDLEKFGTQLIHDSEKAIPILVDGGHKGLNREWG